MKRLIGGLLALAAMATLLKGAAKPLMRKVRRAATGS
jgi:hypothetical protein